ncbi:CYTH domain-containing protein [Neobacillus massiliamazoniensis]|uniref:Adenylate cyclase n=1 Tax=Neobacillus massiliamazoniensis TaxID=1499688 RepID=A0A0U1NZN5_9BACI|nr:CYTH domain-containing protein [Neobacillus massiliamazoniensis]CRK83453.1 adenylate cyclase [Neobacillus massiliamazoniensis]
MSQQIEIEFKNMLTKEEYEWLLQEFSISENQIFSQENHYFDTPDFALKEAGTALRIRQKDHGYELTLKRPANIGLMETNQILSKEEAALALQSSYLPAGIIRGLIEQMGISYPKMVYFGSLITKRVEIEYKHGLLVLDHSYYLNREDYELEFEVENFEQGKDNFNLLLTQFNIPHRKTENKISRFYKQKYESRQN